MPRLSLAAAFAATVLLSTALAMCSRDRGYENDFRRYTPLQSPAARSVPAAPRADERTAFEPR